MAKHKNMGIFYNHLFKQRMGDEVTTVKTEPEETAAEQESTSTSGKHLAVVLLKGV